MHFSKRKGTLAESLTEPGHLLVGIVLLILVFALIVMALKPAYPVGEKTARILNCLHLEWSECGKMLGIG